MANQRALFVAIDDYPGIGNDLPSCVNDAKAMEATVKDRYGFTETKMLLNEDATIDNVKSQLKWLLKDASPNDNLFFFYSGHGSQKAFDGVMEEALVLHDELMKDDVLVSLSQDAPFGALTVCLDACFSGGMEKRVYELLEHDAEVARLKYLKPDEYQLDTFAKAKGAEKAITAYKPFGGVPVNTRWSPKSILFAMNQLRKSDDDDEAGQAQLNGVLLSASSENETAAASTSTTMGLSAFTWALRRVLTSGGAELSVENLVSNVNNVLKRAGFRQTPLVKANPPQLSSRLFLSQNTVATFRHGLADGLEGKDLTAFISPIVAEIVRSITKAELGVSKGSGSNGKGDEVKRWQDLIVPIVTEVIGALTKEQRQNEKLFGIDDAILIPAIVSVVTAMVKEKGFGFSGGFGVSTPLGGASGGLGFEAKGWQDLVVPIVTEVIGALTKEQRQNEKLFGIDDAILIPAIVSVVTAMVKEKGFGFSGGFGVSTPLGGASGGLGFEAKGWQDLIVPIVTEVIGALTKEQSKMSFPPMFPPMVPPPFNPRPTSDLLDGIRWRMLNRS